MNQQVLSPVSPADSVTSGPVGSRRIDTRRGDSKMALSRQWAIRPADERYLSLDALFNATKGFADASQEIRLPSNTLKFSAEMDQPDSLHVINGDDESTRSAMTHWTFGQICGLGEPHAPAGFLRALPAFLAAMNLQYTLKHRGPDVKLYTRRLGELSDDFGAPNQLRAVTSPDYGRIRDFEVVDAVRRIVGNGSESRWKVPGLLDWNTMHYNPHVEPTTDTTTLFASDRDVWLFLCDDLNPIEVGKLADGSPDLIFRGFYVWNSEVGSKSLGVATMYLRGTCCNRILWGVERFQEVTMRHSKFAPDRFLQNVEPALKAYADASDRRLIEGIKSAQSAILAADDDTAKAYMAKTLEFPVALAARVMETHEKEEGRPIRSVWDMVQGITAVARSELHQDNRIRLERVGKKLLDKVA